MELQTFIEELGPEAVGQVQADLPFEVDLTALEYQREAYVQIILRRLRKIEGQQRREQLQLKDLEYATQDSHLIQQMKLSLIKFKRARNKPKNKPRRQ